MALHLNLYHEIHRQEDRERRDPVKFAALVAVVVMLLLVLWYFYRLSAVVKIEMQRNTLQSSWATLSPQMKSASDSETLLLARQKNNQALVERLQGRFYWAPLLEKLAAIVPPNVQIVSLDGDLSQDKTKPKTVDVLMRGVAAGVQPRTAAEDFRRSLQVGFSELYNEVSVVFDANSLEDAPENVQLAGQTLGTSTFRIRVQFKPGISPAPQTASAIEKSK